MKKLISFVLLLLLFSLLHSSTRYYGMSYLNIEWIYLTIGAAFFVALALALKFLFEKGFDFGLAARKRSRWEFTRMLIVILALVIALRQLFSRKVRIYPPSEPPIIKYPKFHFNKTIAQLTYKPLPWYFYLIPILLFFAILATAKIKRARRVSFDIPTFNPELEFDKIEGTQRERIIKMYKNVVAGLIRKGYPYQKSWTHLEHEEKLRDIFEDLADLDALTKIFEKAKYGKELKEDDLKIAKESYSNLMEILKK